MLGQIKCSSVSSLFNNIWLRFPQILLLNGATKIEMRQNEREKFYQWMTERKESSMERRKLGLFRRNNNAQESRVKERREERKKREKRKKIMMRNYMCLIQPHFWWIPSSPPHFSLSPSLSPLELFSPNLHHVLFRFCSVLPRSNMCRSFKTFCVLFRSF